MNYDNNHECIYSIQVNKSGHLNKAPWRLTWVLHFYYSLDQMIYTYQLLQVQAGKGINISARTFHLAQGDILKVSTHTHTQSGIPLSCFLWHPFLKTDQWQSNRKRMWNTLAGHCAVCITLLFFADLWRERQRSPRPRSVHRVVYVGSDADLHFKPPLAGILQRLRKHRRGVQTGLLK